MEALLGANRLMAYVSHAADPRLEGRGVGTAQGAEYARFLEDHLRQAGLPVSIQRFEVPRLLDLGFPGRRLERLFSRAFGTNVIARIEGGDPAVGAETVVLSAHFDHLLPTRDLFHYLFPPLLIPLAPGLPTMAMLGSPLGALLIEFTIPILFLRDMMTDFTSGRWFPAPGRRKVFPGADDNASGTAGLLSIADAFAELGRRGVRPRRTIILAFMDAEEEGERGSKSYVRDLTPEERGRVVQAINLDAIGWSDPKHPHRVSVVTPPAFPLWAQSFVSEILPAQKGAALMDRHNPVLRDKLEALNSSLGLGLELDYTNQDFSTGDQYPFFKMDRPDGRRTSAVLLRDGGHGPSHQEGDTADKVDAAYASRVSRLAAALAWDVANTATLPEYLP